jgi:hypothetical protein
MRLAVHIWAGLLVFIGVPFVLAGERTVPCDAPVQSAKRGLAAEGKSAKDLVAADFQALNTGLSWWYNWSATANNLDPAGLMEFLPMDWGGGSGAITGVENWLAHHTPSTVLAINEPNISSQASLTTGEAATDIQNLLNVVGSIPVVAPQMATASGWEQYLSDVLTAMGSPLPAATSLHSYGNFNFLSNAVSSMQNANGGLPVWITEFNYKDAGTQDDETDFMIQAVDWMEQTPGVARYAWFKDRNSNTSFADILNDTPGSLTTLGNLYVNMPVHDPTLYYAIPGQLDAARYVAMNGIALQRTTDTNGLLEVGQISSGNWLDYNIDVPTAGIYTVSLRVGGTSPARFQILKGAAVLAQINASFTNHATITAGNITLPAGRQTIRLLATGTGSPCLGWIQWLTPFEYWAQNWGLPSDGTGNGAPFAEPAGDGIPNLLKYALVINPYLAGYQGHLTTDITRISGQRYLAVHYTRSDPVPSNITYIGEVSTNLISGIWTNQTTINATVTNGDGTATVTSCDDFPVGAFSQRFIRFKAIVYP